MVLELRESNTGNISFLTFVFDQQERHFFYQLSQDLTKPDFWYLPERVWAVPRVLQHGFLFVQHYPDINRPEMVGIWVLDAWTHEVVWKEALAKQVHISATEITYKVHDQPYTQKIFAENEINKGNNKNKNNEDKNAGNHPQINFTQKTFFPEYYTQDLEYFELVKKFIQKYFPNENPIYEIGYLETDTMLFMGYYCEDKNAYYCIFDKEKNTFLQKNTFENMPDGYVRFWLYDDCWVITPNAHQIVLEMRF